MFVRGRKWGGLCRAVQLGSRTPVTETEEKRGLGKCQ
jgi:hypothetical protein